MLKKLSKSRKKKTVNKSTNSQQKLIKPSKQVYKEHKEQKQLKQYKNSYKNTHAHQSSTFSLLSNHHNHNSSQCSLYQQGKLINNIKSKSKNIQNRQSCSSLIGRGSIEKDKNKERQKQKQKQKYKAKQNYKQKLKQKQKDKDKDKSKNNKVSKKSKKKQQSNPNYVNKNDLKLQKNQKQIPSKKSQMLKNQQFYQRINLALFKSKTNSDINFSDNSSVRQNNISNYNFNFNFNPQLTKHLPIQRNDNNKIYLNMQENMSQSRNKKTLSIDCSDQYILKQYFGNSRIRNYQKRRIEAAIKIQKVFRGYMTRRMLKQYIEKEQERLNQLSKRLQSNSSRQSRMKRQNLEMQLINFGNSNSYQVGNKKMFKVDNEQKKRKQVNKNIFFQSAKQKQQTPQQNGIKYQVFDQPEIEISLKSSKKQIIHPINHEALEQESSIYAKPQDSISQYLQFTQDQKYQNYNNQLEDQSQIFIRSQAHQQPQNWRGYNYQIKPVQELYQNQQNLQIYQSKQLAYKANEKLKQQPSQELFKFTPSSSYQPVSKSKYDEPIPTDFSQRRVQDFDSYAQAKSKQLVNFNKNKKPQEQNYKQQAERNTKFCRKINTIYNSSPSNFIQNYNLPLQYPPKIPTTNLQPSPIQKTQNQRKMISMLKKQQKQKWNKIIQMLNQQMIKDKSRSQQNQSFMNIMLQFSKKNKQQLQKSNTIYFNSNQHLDSQFNQFCQQNNYKQINLQAGFNKLQKQFYQQQQYIQNHQPSQNKQNNLYPEQKSQLMQLQKQLKSFKQQIQSKIKEKNQINSSLNFSNNICNNLGINAYGNDYKVKGRQKRFRQSQQDKNRQNFSLFQKTQQLKNFYKKNWHTYLIEQMIQIRQNALYQRQKQQINKLNEQLSKNNLTHQQFIQILSEMQQKYENQRQNINKAKVQIFMGCRATHKLMQDSVKDACFLGFKIPFTNSLKDFKSQNTTNGVWIKSLIVDQLKSYNNHSNTNFNMNLNNNPYMIQQLKCQKKSAQQNHNNIDEQSLGSFYGRKQQKSSEKKKRHDLSISIPHQDSSLTLKQSNNQISQQSLFSQQISYNEGDIEMNSLVEQGKGGFIFQQDLSQDQEDDKNKEVQGYRKIDPSSALIKKTPINLDYYKQKPLIYDPVELQNLDIQVMRKISINQRRSLLQENFGTIQQIRKYQMTPRNKLIQPSNLKSQIYRVDVQSDSQDDEIIFTQDSDTDIKNITQEVAHYLIWEVVSEIYIQTTIRNKFCKQKNKAPIPISVDERKQFVKHLVTQLPTFDQLKTRLNQKMMASRLDLLKFMRVSFDVSQQDMFESTQEQSQFIQDIQQQSLSSEGFEEIGKFQHILPANVCLTSIENYIRIQQQKQIKELKQQSSEEIQHVVKTTFSSEISYQTIKKVIQREKIINYNKIQRNDLRKQIKKVQLHCIFDSLNEILMKKRLKTSGYSGIGLNQLSKIMQQQNLHLITQQGQFQQIFENSLKQLDQLVGVQKNSSQKLLIENYQRLCQNDSQWICYNDQALSFALQLVYMLEDQIFFQEAVQIFKKL